MAGADYILGCDANTAHDHDKIQDFLQDHDMINAFTKFFDKHPPTHINANPFVISQSMASTVY
jgi:hypothetical protein